MQTRLGLVQHQQFGRARRQQRRDPEQITQGSVRELDGLERAQQTVLPHHGFEAAIAAFHRLRRAREGIVHRRVQGLRIADIANGLQRRGEVGAVMAQDRGVGADLRHACRRGRVGSKVVVEAPGADLFAQGKQLGRAPGVGHLGQHAVERGHAFMHDLPLPVVAARAHQRPAPFHQHRRGPRDRAGPDELALDRGVQRKCRIRGGRQAHVDRIAELRADEAQAQTDGLLAHRALNRNVAAFHRARHEFGPGPQCGGQAAFARERCDHAALRRFRQQAQRLVDVRLPLPLAPVIRFSGPSGITKSRKVR